MDVRVLEISRMKWLAAGISKPDILNDYPELNEEHINACLSFTANRELKMSFTS